MLNSMLRLQFRNIGQRHWMRWSSNLGKDIKPEDDHELDGKRLTEEERKICINDGLENFDHDWEPGFGKANTGFIMTPKEFREGLKQLKIEAKMWWEEFKVPYKTEPDIFIDPDTIYKVFTFKEENSVKEWAYTSDKEQEIGKSTCELTRTSTGNLLFTGNICTDIPADGRTFRTGFASFRSPRVYVSCSAHHRGFYNWECYNHLVLKIRGDGRHYNLNIGQDEDLHTSWYDMSSYFIFTRGGPYWQTVKVPFSKLVSCAKGYARDSQREFKPYEVTFVGLTLQDGVSGPFHLEIEYIGLQNDIRHTEENAYEQYDMEKMFD